MNDPHATNGVGGDRIVASPSLVLAELFTAVEDNNVAAMQQLYPKQGTPLVDIEARNQFGGTPLLVAAVRGSAAVVDYLLAHPQPANVNAVDKKGGTPLLHATINNHLDVVRALLEANADVNLKDNYGATPLLYASVHAHLDLVDLLIEHKADLQVKDDAGHTVLDRTYQVHKAKAKAKDKSRGPVLQRLISHSQTSLTLHEVPDAKSEAVVWFVTHTVWVRDSPGGARLSQLPQGHFFIELERDDAAEWIRHADGWTQVADHAKGFTNAEIVDLSALEPPAEAPQPNGNLDHGANQQLRLDAEQRGLKDAIMQRASSPAAPGPEQPQATVQLAAQEPALDPPQLSASTGNQPTKGLPPMLPTEPSSSDLTNLQRVRRRRLSGFGAPNASGDYKALSAGAVQRRLRLKKLHAEGFLEKKAQRLLLGYQLRYFQSDYKQLRYFEMHEANEAPLGVVPLDVDHFAGLELPSSGLGKNNEFIVKWKVYRVQQKSKKKVLKEQGMRRVHLRAKERETALKWIVFFLEVHFFLDPESVVTQLADNPQLVAIIRARSPELAKEIDAYGKGVVEEADDAPAIQQQQQQAQLGGADGKEQSKSMEYVPLSVELERNRSQSQLYLAKGANDIAAPSVHVATIEEQPSTNTEEEDIKEEEEEEEELEEVDDAVEEVEEDEDDEQQGQSPQVEQEAEEEEDDSDHEDHKHLTLDIPTTEPMKLEDVAALPPNASVKVVLKLDMPFPEKGEEAKFKQEVLNDLAISLGVPRGRLKLVGIRPGSVLVDFVILPPPSVPSSYDDPDISRPIGRSAPQLYRELHNQLHHNNSTLLNRNITQHINTSDPSALVAMPSPVQSSPSQNEPHDRSNTSTSVSRADVSHYTFDENEVERESDTAMALRYAQMWDEDEDVDVSPSSVSALHEEDVSYTHRSAERFIADHSRRSLHRPRPSTATHKHTPSFVEAMAHARESGPSPSRSGRTVEHTQLTIHPIMERSDLDSSVSMEVSSSNNANGVTTTDDDIAEDTAESPTEANSPTNDVAQRTDNLQRKERQDSAGDLTNPAANQGHELNGTDERGAGVGSGDAIDDDAAPSDYSSDAADSVDGGAGDDGDDEAGDQGARSNLKRSQSAKKIQAIYRGHAVRRKMRSARVLQRAARQFLQRRRDQEVKQQPMKEKVRKEYEHQQMVQSFHNRLEHLQSQLAATTQENERLIQSISSVASAVEEKGAVHVDSPVVQSLREVLSQSAQVTPAPSRGGSAVGTPVRSVSPAVSHSYTTPPSTSGHDGNSAPPSSGGSSSVGSGGQGLSYVVTPPPPASGTPQATPQSGGSRHGHRDVSPAPPFPDMSPSGTPLTGTATSSSSAAAGSSSSSSSAHGDFALHSLQGLQHLPVEVQLVYHHTLVSQLRDLLRDARNGSMSPSFVRRQRAHVHYAAMAACNQAYHSHLLQGGDEHAQPQPQSAGNHMVQLQQAMADLMHLELELDAVCMQEDKQATDDAEKPTSSSSPPASPSGLAAPDPDMSYSNSPAQAPAAGAAASSEASWPTQRRIMSKTSDWKYDNAADEFPRYDGDQRAQPDVRHTPLRSRSSSQKDLPVTPVYEAHMSTVLEHSTQQLRLMWFALVVAVLLLLWERTRPYGAPNYFA